MRAHLPRVSLAVEEKIAPRPMHVGLLGSQAVVPKADLGAQLAEEVRGSGLAGFATSNTSPGLEKTTPIKALRLTPPCYTDTGGALFRPIATYLSLDGTEMALSEFEQKRCEKIVSAFIEQRRPPSHIRPKLDLGFRVAGQSVEIFEIRPQWDDPKVIREHAVAKATYVKTEGAWRVYWQRRDLKWHRYDPAPIVESLEAFLKLVNEDAHACFWG